MLKSTKADLYKKTLTYINSLYQSPQNVVAAVPDESITVNANTESLKGWIGIYKYPLTYNIVLEFKDGKIKFEPKVIELYEVSKIDGEKKPYYIESDGKNRKCVWLRQANGQYIIYGKELKRSLDQWVNDYIAGISQKVNDNW